MNDAKQSITFRTSNTFLLEPGLDYGTFQEGNQKYLFVNLERSIHTLDRNIGYLLVPDDNSDLANLIKNDPMNQENILFNTPFQNLKFKLAFKTRKLGDGSEDVYHGWTVKDTSQVKKILGTEPPPPTLTFKVQQQKKSEVDQWGNYSHQLIIEPVSLGVENLPSITKLIFNFSSPPPGSAQVEDPQKKNLKKSKLYNSNILPDSVGKTFTVAIRVWLLENEKEKKTGEYNYNTLYLASDNEFDWDSFREIKETVSAEKSKDLPKLENKDNKSSNSQQESQSDKGIANSTKILAGVGIILTVFGLIMAFLVYQKKNAKGKL